MGVPIRPVDLTESFCGSSNPVSEVEKIVDLDLTC